MPEVRNIETLPILASYDLTAEERKEFDWINDSSMVTWDDAEFFRYRDSVYCLSDFERASADLRENGWDAMHVDTFFSAVVVMYDYDCEDVKIGLYLD